VIDIDTSNKTEQRKFGIVMAIAIVIIGVVRWAIHGFAGGPPYYFMAVAAPFLVLGILFPKGLQPVFVLWMKLAVVLNWIMTRLLLSIVFYLMISPVRLVRFLFAEDPLKRKWLAQAASYWEEPEEQPEEFDRYRNQY
jgi:hypothetical protein